MKRATINHPKTGALMEALGISRRECLGLLQLLWDFTGQYAPRGDIGRFTNHAIAKACDHDPKQADELVLQLVETKWLDKVPDPAVRLLIHDWPDHCEGWVKKRVAREQTPFLTPADCRAKPRRRTKTAGRNGKPKRQTEMDALPKPKPKPKPKPTPSQSRSRSRAASEAGERPDASEPAPSDSSRSVCASTSVSDSSDARGRGHVKFAQAVTPLFGRNSGARHPAGSSQYDADQTCARRWWEERIWPQDLPPPEGEKRLALFLDIVRRSTVKDKPMAWITKTMKLEMKT